MPEDVYALYAQAKIITNKTVQLLEKAKQTELRALAACEADIARYRALSSEKVPA